MSKKASSTKDASSASSSSSAAAVTPAEVDKAWQLLGTLLAKDEPPHQLVQPLAEKIFRASVAQGEPDAAALEVVTVAMVQQSKWSALVALLGAHPALVSSTPALAFHLAYALYRDKQHSRALEELRRRALQPGGLSDGELHLQAQALYRAGQYAQAAKVYRDTHLAEEHDVELQANLLAALVSAGQLDEAKTYMQKLRALSDPESYELAYNAACGLVERGDYAGALPVVRKAQILCREMLEADGASEADIDHELAGLQVQEAFILQQLSRLPGADGSENEHALSLYTHVLSSRRCDPNVSSIASNNVITLRKGQDRIWDSLKKSDRAMALDLKDMTLSTRQKSAIQLNRALVLFYGKQFDKCRDLLQTLAREFPANVQIALAQAAVLARDKSRLREAEDALREWARNNEATATPDAVQAVHLGLAHLALVKGDVAAAAATLSTLSKGKGASLQHRPATVATLVSLYERCNDLDAAHKTIQNAIQHWQSTSKKDPAAARLLQRILSSAGAFYTRHGREQDAAQLLELLAAETQSGSSASSRAESVARLVLAYANDESKQAQYVAQLPALSVPKDLDVSHLESVPAPEVSKRRKDKSASAASAKKSASAAAGAAAGGEDGADTDGEDGDGEEKAKDVVSASLAKAAARKAHADRLKAKRASKVRVPRRLPKNFDPANPGPMPDPERWLPRWERSNQKKYKRKGNVAANAIRGAQGSTNAAMMAATQSSALKTAEDEGVEQKGKMSAAAQAAARKRAGKKGRADKAAASADK